jgi:N-acetylglutamate synthase-like GNAT family acetyltransferase
VPNDDRVDASLATGAPPGVELRWVSGSDALMRQVADLCYETLHAPFGVERSDDWDNADPRSSHLVALTGRRVAGYARLITEGEWGHVRQVAVAPHMRGRGIGSALVAETLESARKQRLRRVYLNARMGAVGLYERAGFRVVSPEPFPMPRTYLPHVRMELDPL